MVGTSRLTAMEAIDVANRRIVAQAGVVDLWATKPGGAHGLCYAPDPSSQPACTIGGKLPENSGRTDRLQFGVPPDAGAVLLVERDGPAVGLGTQAERVCAVCRQNRVREVHVARDDAERAALWKCRKRAFGAVGRLAPNYCTQDGVVPRTRVPDILRRIAAAAERHRLRIANVFHAGDGNIHPILLFDERDRDEVRRVL